MTMPEYRLATSLEKIVGISFEIKETTLTFNYQPSGSSMAPMDLDTLVRMEAGTGTSDPIDEIDTPPFPTLSTPTLESIGVELSDKQAGKCPRRERQLPSRYRDVLPEPPPVVINNGATSDPISTCSFPRICLIV
jgi:hypothetical protein